jgi:signal transduction histidine kinase
VIRDLANDALHDLRGVLGVLRDPETGELASAPQPTWADLPALVDQAREAGVHVELSDRLTGAEQVPDVVGRTLYRIVQEGITNAGKHAPGATIRVEVTGSPDDGVEIVLRNPLGFGPTRTPGSGLGLVGLAERAELRGGRLQGRREGRQFVLRGWIPWAA